MTDSKGEPVRGLTAADFRVEEDGRPQAIQTFAAGEFPLAVAIGVDRSFSVPPRPTWRSRRGRAHVRPAPAAVRPGDGACDRQRDRGRQRRCRRITRAATAALDRLEPWGTTPLYDATLNALDAIQSASGRRALILLSDGEDRYSAASADAVVAEARRRDVLVYPIATGRKRPPMFAELASVTGGRSFHAAERRALEAALDSDRARAALAVPARLHAVRRTMLAAAGGPFASRCRGRTARCARGTDTSSNDRRAEDAGAEAARSYINAASALMA